MRTSRRPRSTRTSRGPASARSTTSFIRGRAKKRAPAKGAPRVRFGFRLLGGADDQVERVVDELRHLAAGDEVVRGEVRGVVAAAAIAVDDPERPDVSD